MSESKAFYLGANSFSQMPRCSELTCREPKLISEEFSLIGCNFSSIYWLNSTKTSFTCSGLYNIKQDPLPENIELKQLFSGLGTICGAGETFLMTLKEPSTVKISEKLTGSSEIIEKISTCGKTIYCQTSQGRVLNLTEEESAKMVVEIPGTVTLLACGEEHCLAVTKEKEVFSWGSSLKGQLGRGTLKEELSPARIPALGGLDIIQVACGKWHNVALTKEGDLYVWGWNKYGQLGFPCPDFEHLESIESSTTVLAEPQLLDFQIGVKKIACGSMHTVVLADDNKVWGCGFTKFGQLGFQENIEKVDKLVPLKVNFPNKIVDLFASNWSTILIADINS